MLPEVGASEMIVLAAVALIVVGPKDLPMLLRRIGQMVRKLRLLAADFRASFDDMARQSELDDLRKEVEALRQTNMSDVLKDLPTLEELSADPSARPLAAPYDDTQDKLDAGFAPQNAALTAPEPAPSILPAAKKASKPSAKGPAKPAAKPPAKAVPKAAAKPTAKPKARAKSPAASESKA